MLQDSRKKVSVVRSITYRGDGIAGVWTDHFPAELSQRRGCEILEQLASISKGRHFKRGGLRIGGEDLVALVQGSL